MSDGPFIRPVATKKVDGRKLPHVYVEGGTISTGAASPESIRIDDAGTYQYFGYAVMGGAEGSAIWKISRLTVANPQALLWADGNAEYDNIWTNRASLSYS
jgi:hypothetical protein